MSGSKKAKRVDPINSVPDQFNIEEDEEETTAFEIVDKRPRVVRWASQFWNFITSLGGLAVIRGTIALVLSSFVCYFASFGGTNGLLSPVMVLVFDHKRYTGGLIQSTIYFSVSIVLGLGISLLCAVISVNTYSLLATQFIGVFLFAFAETLFPKLRGALIIGSLFLAFEIFSAFATQEVPIDSAIELTKSLYTGLAVAIAAGLVIFPRTANNAIRKRTSDLIDSTQATFQRSVEVFLSIPPAHKLDTHDHESHTAKLEEGPHFQHNALVSGREKSRAIYADLLSLFPDAEGELSWSIFSGAALSVWRIRLTELLQFEESLSLNRRNLRKRLRVHHREEDLSELVDLVRKPIEILTRQALTLGCNVSTFLKTGVNEKLNGKGEKEALVGKFDYTSWNEEVQKLQKGQLSAQKLFLTDAKWEDSEWDEVTKQFFFYTYSFLHYLENLRQMEQFLANNCSKKSLHFIMIGPGAFIPNLQGCFGDKMDIWHQPFHGFGSVYDPPPQLPALADPSTVLPLAHPRTPTPSDGVDVNGNATAARRSANIANTQTPQAPPPNTTRHGSVGKMPEAHVWIETRSTKPSGYRESIWSFLQVSNSFQFRAALKMALAVLFLSVFAFIPTTTNFFFDWRMTWSVVTVMVVMSPYFSDSFTNGFWRFLGTITGALFGLVAWAIFGMNEVGIGFTTIIAGLVGFYLKHNVPQYSRLGYVGMVTYVLVVFTPYLTDFDPLELSYKRGCMILLGVATSILFGRIFFPFLARTQLRFAVSTILFRLSDIYTFEKHLTSRTDLTSEKWVESIRWLSRQHDLIHLALVDARGLVALASLEPRLRATFPAQSYGHVLNCCQRMLINHRFIVSLVSTGFAARLSEIIMPLNQTRHEMTANVVMFFYLLASCLRMKIPLPVYMPPALKSRDRVIKRFHKFLHNKGEIVDQRETDLMHWLQYAGLGKSIVMELEEAGRHVRNDLWF